MGRHDLRALRVHRMAARLVETGRLKRAPAWYGAVGVNPPSQILVRSQPIQHQEHSRRRPGRKPSKLFMPQKITYEEDALRKQFFADHPWELARPRTLIETDGKDHQRHNWNSIRQPTRRVDGESVVQRQMWLLQNQPGMTKEKAYDQARSEFYIERQQQEVEARIAKEEALSTSAYFGKTTVQIGSELEDQSYERWRQSAHRYWAKLQQKRAAAVNLMTPGTAEDAAEPAVDDPAQEAVDPAVGETSQNPPM